MTHTVLVVDDEFGVPELLEFVLEEEGYHVITAANGHQGLQRLAEKPRPELVLLDFMMPVLNGPAMLRAIREGPYKETPVVFISSLDEATVRRECSLSFEAFLRKPFKLTDVVGLVRRLLPD